MHIKSIVLEGFKSYGQRTVIDGFDQEFNAITGLNGTGKSNILDSICFVLGISQLSNVRVTSLQDLVYKSGQAGITKATVSITFDNRDKESAPAGFEDYNEIVVTRQVVMGGKNKYVINGVNVQNKRVQDLFCSVQLNVNNPHFLIMQGRITKVLNMKPPEILSMVEEAAGTKMYENKKLNAEKSIEKKDAKLTEINNLCNEELIPKLNKLREERKMYLEFQRIERELENLTCMFAAWQLAMSRRAMQGSLQQLDTKQVRLQQLRDNISANQQRVAAIDQDVLAHQQKDESINLEVQTLEASLKERERHLAKAEASERGARQAITTEEKKLRGWRTALADDEAALRGKQAETDSQAGAFQALQDEQQRNQQDFASKQKRYEALQAGMEIGDDGQAATLQEQLIKAKADAAEASTIVKQASMQLQHSEQQLRIKQKELSNTSYDFKKDKTTMDNMDKSLKNLTHQMEQLKHDPDAASGLQTSRRDLVQQARGLRDWLERFEAQHPQLDLRYSDPEPGFNRRAVKGLVCRLIKLQDKRCAQALETAAGSKIFNVITDTEQTGKKLLQHGKLQHRVTIVPLNKIKGNPVSSATVKYAQSLVGADNVFTALSILEYNNELKPAMEFIFGSILICSDLTTAKRIAFDPRILRRCVTLDGDIVDPAGTLSGGARAQHASFLLQLDEYQAKLAQRAALDQQLAKLDSQLANLERVRDKYTEVKHKWELMMHEYNVLQSRVQQTSHYQAQEEVDQLKKTIAELTESMKENKEKERVCCALAKKLESEIKNSAANRDQKIRTAEAEMKEAKKRLDACKAGWRDKEQYFEALKLEVQELQKAIQNGHEQIQLCELAIADLKEKLSEAEAATRDAKEVVTKCQAEYKEKKHIVASKNKEIQKKQKEKNDLLAQNAELELEIKKNTHELNELESRCKAFKDKEKELKKKIKDDDTRLKDAEKMTDAEGHELGKRIAKSQEHRNKLSRNINAKAQSMFEQEEKQYANLMKKKKIIEIDRKKLLNFIEEMDQKKISFLKTAVDQISKDFGSIFSTLLPGTSAKLNPPENKSILDGLEIKVGIGGIWKDNLSELSGGQKSLIALSLILAMLLFKPAPIYILDEVDAALDLSHTQNIGKMLKKHFKQSQFIIVSLKDGMFNNANVLFRTKFVNGMSAVTRTVNENAKR